jgi:PIN domain nuclease of toxin-antitoxin system
MRLLLDTHTFLWFIDDNPRLSARAKGLLESDTDLLLSVVSLWEISIKVSISKLSLAEPYDIFMPRQLTANAIEVLPISWLISAWLLRCRFIIVIHLIGC